MEKLTKQAKKKFTLPPIGLNQIASLGLGQHESRLRLWARPNIQTLILLKTSHSVLVHLQAKPDAEKGTNLLQLRFIFFFVFCFLSVLQVHISWDQARATWKRI